MSVEDFFSKKMIVKKADIFKLYCYYTQKAEYNANVYKTQDKLLKKAYLNFGNSFSQYLCHCAEDDNSNYSDINYCDADSKWVEYIEPLLLSYNKELKADIKNEVITKSDFTATTNVKFDNKNNFIFTWQQAIFAASLMVAYNNEDNEFCLNDARKTPMLYFEKEEKVIFSKSDTTGWVNSILNIVTDITGFYNQSILSGFSKEYVKMKSENCTSKPTVLIKKQKEWTNQAEHESEKYVIDSNSEFLSDVKLLLEAYCDYVINDKDNFSYTLKEYYNIFKACEELFKESSIHYFLKEINYELFRDISDDILRFTEKALKIAKDNPKVKKLEAEYQKLKNKK